MSIAWLLFLFYAWEAGADITESAFFMTSILYVGDCILIGARKVAEYGKTKEK